MTIEQLIQTFNERHNTNYTFWNQIPDRFKEELLVCKPDNDDYIEECITECNDSVLVTDLPF
tara:strand:- start:1483 stop:1668 length:186 start_codon:yes stop_codon:yes gene_type:complete